MIDVEGSEFLVLLVVDWTVSVDYFIIEMSPASSDENRHRIESLLTTEGCVPVTWDLKDWCTPVNDCSSNTVFAMSHDGGTTVPSPW